MNKTVLTNLSAAGFVVAGFLVPSPWQSPVLNIGLFALAGAVTNSLAIHMLFEKVPGLYGSGVITARFSTFKHAIEQMVMQQFFSREHLDRFFEEMLSAEQQQLDFSTIIDNSDLTPAWESLLKTIKESSFGGMLSMFGGEKALKPLKTPFIERMKRALNKLAHSEEFQHKLRQKLNSDSASEKIHQQISLIVHKRLDELTPDMVKQIIQQMIRQHLGWLVVWGGVFGGLIGLGASFLPI